MTNAIKATGNHYFTASQCPIAVVKVSAASTPQYDYDLTDIVHYHDFSELVIVTAGEGIQLINNVEYPVECGDVFLLQGFSRHAFPQREKVSLINIQFAAETLPLPLAFLRKIPGYNVMFQLEPTLRSRRSFKHRLHLDQSKLQQVLEMVEKLRVELNGSLTGFEVAALSLLLEIITFVSRQYSVIHADNYSAMVRLGHVISKLESDFASPWNLTKIAKLAKSSPNNLLRLFKAATGDSPIDYLIKVRLRHAAELLLTTDMTITEISFNCGFNDPNYFTKQFTAIYQMSPRKYRNTQ